MNQYHKIQSVFNRDPEDNFKTFIEGSFAKPEFEVLKDINWTWTEKIDGTNIRVIWDGSNVIFKGKTDRANLPAHLAKKLRELFTVDKLEAYFGHGEMNVCLYGEGYGRKIQKGGNYIQNDVDFILFDVRIGNWWIERSTVEIMARDLGINVVPIIDIGPLEKAIELVKQGFKSTIAQNKDYLAEGLICKPDVELFDRKGDRVITKIKHKDFK
jgi:ATP-dependent RNA circularization protein (DNA/RNA ligase family)